MTALGALLELDLLVVTGKGGAGKTTVAGALGLAAARQGQRVVVVEVAARDDLSRSLSGVSTDPFAEREVAPGLFHVSVDPQHAMEEYLVDQLPVKALAEALVRSRLFTYLAAATPGMRELLTAGKVWELAQPTRRTPGARPYDLVVLDAPATGHALALLSAPRTFADAARVGPIARQGRTIHAMLTDPARTGVIAVAIGEELAVTEALLIRDEVRAQLGLELAGAVLNARTPDRLTDAEAAALDAALGPPAPPHAAPPPHATPPPHGPAAPSVASALRTARTHHRRARSQAEQAQRLAAALPGVPRWELPLVVAAKLGPAELGELADGLAR